MNKKVVRFDSGYFCAAAIFEDNKCILAAPIIKWMIGKTKKEIWTGKTKNWDIQICNVAN